MKFRKPATGKDKKLIQDMHSSEWIRLRSEQLAVRAQPERFTELYTARALEFGFKGMGDAHRAFTSFMSPYVVEAERAHRAETRADYQMACKMNPTWGSAKK